MRDISLLLFLVAMIPLIFPFPVVGTCLWIWISVMNPHRMVYSFASGQPINQIIAIATIIAIAISSSPKKLEISSLVVTLGIFTLWCTITTFTVAVSPMAPELWERMIKTAILAIVIQMTVRTPVHLHALIWVLVVSIGYHAALGGLRTISSGGSAILTGPIMSQMYDNNHFAVATLMSIPLLAYLRGVTKNAILRLGLLGQILLSIVCVMGTNSRGGTIAMVAVLLALWARSKNRLLYFALAVALSGTVVSMLPQRYIDRMSTISSAAESDTSFQQRLNAWFVALNTANDHPLGVGFEGPIQPQIWDRYLPDTSRHAAHSIYFMVLGEQGWFGFGLYLVFLFAVWQAISRLIRTNKLTSETAWAHDLGKMCQVGMVGFLIGGAALSIAYSEIFVAMAGIVYAALRISRDASRNPSLGPSTRPVPQPRTARLSAARS